MIAIKDMEMPTKCSNCPFNNYYENLGGYICEYLEKVTDKDERWEKKLDNCPLVEIVTCKDCKKLNECFSAMSDRWFCPLGERKK